MLTQQIQTKLEWYIALYEQIFSRVENNQIAVAILQTIAQDTRQRRIDEPQIHNSERYDDKPDQQLRPIQLPRRIP